MRGHEQYSGKADTSEPAHRQAAPPSAQTAARVAATGAGADLSAGMVMALQRTAGNAAVAGTLRSRHALDASNDQRDPTSDHTQGSAAVQRSSAAPSAEVQRSSVHRVLSSAGRPLDEPVRQEMEARLGADLSEVRMHTDAAARASAAEIDARAYTSGNHVVLGEGGADRHTLAHELTHVIQQRHGPVAGTDNGTGLKISDPSDRFEREAEANATRILRGPVPASAADRAPSAQDTASTSAGSAAAVQRVRSKADWADKILTEQKQNMPKPTGWGDAAMHHKISKERLAEIAYYLDEALHNHNEAAKAFHTTCLKAVDKGIKKKNYGTAMLLWNMATNISVGPKNPVGDPGMQFDADTEVDPDTQGGRRMDEVSRHLKDVEDLWMAARMDETRIAAVWDGMNQSMQAAVEAHENLAGAAGALASPKLEQWVADTAEDHTSHHRKGLRAFPGEQAGMDIFARNWQNADGLDGGTDAVSHSFTKVVDGRQLKLTMNVTGEAIYHICRRHTFKHFDFDDIKAVNNFWPAETDAKRVREVVEGTIEHIVKECFEYYLERSGIDVENYETPDEVRLKNIPAGGHTIFIIGAIEDVEPEDAETVEVGGGKEDLGAEVTQPESSRPKDKRKKGRMKLPKALTKLTGKLAKEKDKGKEKAVETAPQQCWHYKGIIHTLAPDGSSSQTFLKSELLAIKAALLASANASSDQ